MPTPAAPTVVHVITNLGLGGAQRLLLDLARRVDPMRSRWRIASLEGPIPAELAGDARILDLSRSGRFDPAAPFRLARVLRAESAAIVHTHLVHADVIGELAAWLAGTPWRVTTRHHAREPKEKTLVYRLADAAARSSDAAVAVSGAVAAHLRERGIARPPRVRVIENGVDVDLFDPSRLEGMPPRQELIVGTAGRLTAQKNLSLLLEAFATIPPCSRGPFLEIAGEGPMRSALEQRARALGIAERARFLGEVPREGMPRLLARFDLFALPSSWEPFGLAAAEAMAMARAVVASRVDGLAELIEDGRSGILLPPDSPLAWASSLRACLDDPARRAELGAAARERIVAGYSIEANLEKLLALYDELLARSTPSSS